MKTPKELMAVKLIPEILEECALAASEEAAAEILKKNDSPALRMILAWTFAPDVYFDAPIPKWKPDPNPLGLSPNSLFIEARRIYLFSTLKVLAPNVKEQLLLNILESVHPTEAELLLKVLNRDLQIPTVTYKTVRLAFPSLLPLAD